MKIECSKTLSLYICLYIPTLAIRVQTNVRIYAQIIIYSYDSVNKIDK